MKVRNLIYKPFKFNEDIEVNIIGCSIFFSLISFISLTAILNLYNSNLAVLNKISYLWLLAPITLGVLGAFFSFGANLFNKIVYQCKHIKYKKEFNVIEWVKECSHYDLETNFLNLSIYDPHFTLLGHLYDMIEGSTDDKVKSKIRDIMISIDKTKRLEEEEKERCLLNKLECFDRVQENYIKYS